MDRGASGLDRELWWAGCGTGSGSGGLNRELGWTGCGTGSGSWWTG